MIPDSVDPYAHLHKEDYSTAYNFPVLGHETLVFTQGRPAQSLNGEWYCTLDVFDEGLRQEWFIDTHRPEEQWDIPRDYEVEGGKIVTVPGCVNLYDARWDRYEGAMWFTRDFDCRPKKGERVFLKIGAAASQARIFLNEKFLGMHLGASTPFCVELSSLQEGMNRLQIQVDNTRRAEHVPMNHIDWFNYGGLYRDVALYSVPETFIADFGAALVPDGTFSRLRFDIRLSSPVDGEALVEIPALGLCEKISVSGGRGEIDVQASPELWSPENPHLYNVRVSFGTDLVTDRVGFREIRVRGEEIFLNGKPLWLRGISAHEEYPSLGKAATEGSIRSMLADARALGCNFMRLAHYPHHESAARLADELGFMLWEEIPVYWAIKFGSPETLSNAENQLRELIKRDRNRASVILWGVGNENADTDERFSFMSHLANVAREADGTRLVSAACLINREKFMIEDRLAACLDVIGINEYFGWYEADMDHLSYLLERSSPGKPVIITETGADAVVGLRGGKRRLFTEDCQVDVYRQQIERLRKASYVKGMTPWILYDFRTERRQTRFQGGYNRKGLIAADHRTRKDAFDVLRQFYLSLAEGG